MCYNNSVKGRYKKNPGQKKVTSMARAIAECKCNKCGAKFEKVQFRPNRKMADEKDAAEAEALIEELHLPEIVGKSEKQVKYASDLRNKYIVRSAEYIRFMHNCLFDEQFKGRKQCEAEAKKEGLSVSAWIEKRANSTPYDYENHAAWTVLHSSEAREIIDALTSY